MSSSHNVANYMNPFFNNYLAVQRGLSHNTILAYRDALKLFLCFAADSRKKSVEKLILEELDENMLLAFLSHLEKNRAVTARTRNARLSAIRTFFKFVARETPDLLEQCRKIRTIPKKREEYKMVEYLDSNEIKTLLNSIDLNAPNGLRDKALLMLLFNTGARAQELVDLRIQDLRLDASGQVRLIGKGKKQRSCPLWPDTVDTINLYLQHRKPNNPNEPFLFLNANGKQLTRFGIRYIIKKHAAVASRLAPTIADKNVNPHTFRHSTAMHLIQAGNDIHMVSMWLGHADINTTHIYLEIDLEMKRKMLLKTTQPDSTLDSYSPPWKQDSVLKWLDALSSKQKLCEAIT